MILDASRSGEFRGNIYTVIKTMEIAFEKKDCDLTLTDSVTGFYEHKEILARQVVRVLFNFLKGNGRTGIFISQRRSSQQAESAEAAGGLEVAHIVDGTIIFDKKLNEIRSEHLWPSHWKCIENNPDRWMQIKRAQSGYLGYDYRGEWAYSDKGKAI